MRTRVATRDRTLTGASAYSAEFARRVVAALPLS